MQISAVSRGVALVVVFATTAACSKDPEVAKREYLESGDKYFAQEKYAEAIVQYRNAIQQDPRFGEARYKLGETYRLVNDWPNALREYVRAADLLPGHVDAQLKAGSLLLLAGRFEDAKARAGDVLKVDARNINAQILLGNAMAGLKDLDGAIAEMEEAIRLQPEASRVYTSLGTLQLVRGDRQQAEAAFRRAVATDPASVNAHLALANFYWSSGRPAEAEQSLKQAIGFDPASIPANRAFAAFYIASNRGPEAERYLKAVTDAAPTARARLALADYYIEMRRMKDARAILEAVAAGPEGVSAAKTRLALIAHAEDRRPEAHTIIDELLGQEPTNADALLLKGRLLLLDKKGDDALARVQAAIVANPQSAAAYYVLGTIHRDRNDLDEAINAFNEVLKLNAKAADAQMELARLHLARGSAEVAVQFAEESVRNRPGNPDAHLTLARSLIVHGDLARAESEMMGLLAKFPASAPVHSQMGMLYLRKADSGAAQGHFDRALQLDPHSIEALTGLVAMDVMAKRLPQARARIGARLATTPDSPTLLLLAAQTYAADRDWHPTEQALRRATEVDPANLRAYTMLGESFLLQGKLDQARREFEELARRQPRSVPAHTTVAVILEMQKKPAEARARYEQVLQVDPRAAVAANNLAWMYAEGGGSLDVALQLAQTAKAQLPDQPEVNDTLGWIYYKKDLATLAVPFLQQSVEKDPKNPIFQYHLGLAYAKTGATARAQRALQLALKLQPNFDGAAEARKALASIQD